VRLRADHPGLYTPGKVNPGLPAVTSYGDVEAGLTTAAARIDVTYTTPVQHNNPMEPHAALAAWDAGGNLTVYDSTQGPSADRDTIASVLGLPPDRVRVISPHVGGGFGSKGTTRPHAILAALAARAAGRPVKVALTRQQMFELTGYRTPTIQRLALGANATGRLTAVAHDVVEQTATRTEFAEQTAVCTRVMYASPAMRTTHRLARLNVPMPSWMRAPGETPGMYALESAMDELACAAGLDPVELRIRNEPATEPDSGLPFSSRNLVACLREGARRFGTLAVVLHRQVAANRQAPLPGRFDQFRRVRGILVLDLRQVGDRDIGAFLGEGHRHRPPDARVAAGDQGAGPRQQAPALVVPHLITRPRIHLSCPAGVFLLAGRRLLG
jgi:xanthine dehydrogenase YagR molybdenum-binding subunit